MVRPVLHVFSAFLVLLSTSCLASETPVDVVESIARMASELSLSQNNQQEELPAYNGKL